MTENVQEDRRAKALRQVQGLLAQAASTGFTAEAEAFRAKADQIMIKFVIEDQELRMARPADQRTKPESRRVVLVGRNSAIKQEMGNLASTIARHCGARIVFYGWDRPAKSYGLDVKVYGFAADLDYFELLLASLTSHLLCDMEPKPDPSLGDLEKLDVVRSAGIPWPRAFELCGWDKTKGNRVMMEWRKARPEQRFVMPSAYQKSFVVGFNAEVWQRLHDLRIAREVHTPGTALVLVDRAAEVNEFYEGENSGLRAARSKSSTRVEAAIRSGKASGSRADIGQTRFGGDVRGRINS